MTHSRWTPWIPRCVGHATLALLIGASCTAHRPARPHLRIDERYRREIVFDTLDLVIPITGDERYLRDDGAVADIDAHTRALLDELGLDPARVRMDSPARYGRQMCVEFAGGRVCSFLWVARDESRDVEIARGNHERYHATCALEPDAVDRIQARLLELGYRVDLASLEEEQAAVVLEVVTLYLRGNEFVFGPGRVLRAVELLEAGKL